MRLYAKPDLEKMVKQVTHNIHISLRDMDTRVQAVDPERAPLIPALCVS